MGGEPPCSLVPPDPLARASRPGSAKFISHRSTVSHKDILVLGPLGGGNNGVKRRVARPRISLADNTHTLTSRHFCRWMYKRQIHLSLHLYDPASACFSRPSSRSQISPKGLYLWDCRCVFRFTPYPLKHRSNPITLFRSQRRSPPKKGPTVTYPIQTSSNVFRTSPTMQ